MDQHDLQREFLDVVLLRLLGQRKLADVAGRRPWEKGRIRVMREREREGAKMKKKTRKRDERYESTECGRARRDEKVEEEERGDNRTPRTRTSDQYDL